MNVILFFFSLVDIKPLRQSLRHRQRQNSEVDANIKSSDGSNDQDEVGDTGSESTINQLENKGKYCAINYFYLHLEKKWKGH